MPLNVRGTAKTKLKEKAQRERNLLGLAGLEPDQVDQWITDNVKSVGDIRNLLKYLLKKAIADDEV